MPPGVGLLQGLWREREDPNGKGYCPDYGQPSKTDGKRLIAHPIDSEVVKLAYSWYLEGNSSDAIICGTSDEFVMELPNGERSRFTSVATQAFRYRALSRKIPSATCSTGYFYTGVLPYKTSNGLGARRTRSY